MASICILSAPSEPLAGEVEARVTSAGYLTSRVDPAETDLGALAGALAAMEGVIAVRPRAAAATLALGLARGLGKSVLVIDAGEAIDPRSGMIVVAGLDALIVALEAHVPHDVFVDVQRARAVGHCEEGVAWFARRYPSGANTTIWTQEEQLQALKDGGAPWLERSEVARYGKLWPMDGADLRGADLHGGRLDGYSFVGAHLDGADLTRCSLRGAIFRQAVLIGAKLWRARLSEADLRGADLSGATLTHAVLRRARLSGAKLTQADLTGADLSGADLTGVDLRQTTLSGAHFGASILVRANLEGCDLAGLDFTGASLREARLAGATLAGTNLSHVDLRGAQTEQADLSLAGLAGAQGLSSRD